MACISGQSEIGSIEQIKALRTELKIHSLRDLEILEQGHIHIEEIWSNKRVAPEVAYARPNATAWYSEETARTLVIGTPALRPHIMGRVHIACQGVWPPEA